MREQIRRKRWALSLCVVMLALVMTGCATVPPQPITGLTPTLSPTEIPVQTQATDGTQDIEPAEGVTASPSQADIVRQAAETVAPTQVELFYSGMPSLMGFADAWQATVYENVMDALPACVSLCWPSAAASFFRYGADIGKESMRVDKESLLAMVGSPSFYRDTPLLSEPARLKYTDAPLDTGAANLNEPVPSFYDSMGQAAPIPQSGLSGTPVAVAASDTKDTTLSIIVTDLHELRMDDGALLTALNERCLQLGRAVGLAAITSEFAGYIPGIGANDTTFVWGAPPNGTLDYTIDYTDYLVGVSIDPEQRATEPRPFYVLVIGDQGAVKEYLQTLEERLTRELSANSAFQMKTAVFGSGYVPAGYTLAGHMRYVAGQGVTAIPEASAPAGVSLIELKASRDARYLQWEIDYTMHPADPRGTNVTADDFNFFVEAASESGEITVLPNLNWSILSSEGGKVTLSLRVDLPEGILSQGNYTLEIIGSLAAPDTLPGSDWLPLFGYDADGAMLLAMEQGTAAFDGSRTLFLSRLIDTLGKANLNRLGVGPLGTVTIALTVYA